MHVCNIETKGYFDEPAIQYFFEAANNVEEFLLCESEMAITLHTSYIEQEIAERFDKDMEDTEQIRVVFDKVIDRYDYCPILKGIF